MYAVTQPSDSGRIQRPFDGQRIVPRGTLWDSESKPYTDLAN
jgi:hypothetical protein